ncbi:hypothetical protein AGR7B_Lc40216 [Agrobacterium deltaense RV3]|nr:hypothetical protein AGR7B_Lc40216 [Agrobacterium deltaense RV3]
MAGCRVKPGMTDEGSTITNINPAILPGFLLPKSAFHPFSTFARHARFREKLCAWNRSDETAMPFAKISKK